MAGSLFAIELCTSRWEEMVRWYRDVAGLRTLVRVPEDQYALLAGADLAGGVGRLAILGRSEVPAASARWSLAVEVDDLSAAIERWRRWASANVISAPQPRQHAEGYGEFVVSDPDGNRVRLYAWRQPR